MQPVRRWSHLPRPRAVTPIALALAGALAGCGPARRREPPAGRNSATSAGTTAAAAPARVPMAGMAGMGRSGGMGGMMGRAAPPAAGSTTAPTAPPNCRAPNAAAIARGRADYAGATCTSCHGPDAHGTGIAPNLADRSWLDADGSFASIAAVIRAGVPHPRQFAAPMPPAGGARLDAQQLCDVAAYVYSLSH